MSTIETPQALVSATQSAIDELRRLISSEGDAVTGVRMAVKGGGCSGLSYVLDFDMEREGDNIVESYVPRFNSMVMFKVPLMHCVSYVAPFAQAPRHSLTGWFTT